MQNNNTAVKSSSDTTIYAPTFTKSPVKVSEKDLILDKISNFVDEMRLQHDSVERPSTSNGKRENDRTPPAQHLFNNPDKEATPPIPPPEDNREEACKLARKLIEEGEQFEANVEKPTGNEFSDDKFFHLLCHIDAVMMAKIQKGDFVELERLLPPDRFQRNSPAEETRLEFRQVNGPTYLAPEVGKEKRISHIRKWEQAFRVYASIYCQSNPTRTTEIWQYIDVINTAAASYSWENVAKYDYTFRQLMAFNPSHNWGSIYNQMWNLAMTEPLSLTRNSSQSNKSDNSGSERRKSGAYRDLSDYCWSFNRGYCKLGSQCDFINRCKYCDSTSHGENACVKLACKRREKGEDKDNNRSRKQMKIHGNKEAERSDKQ